MEKDEIQKKAISTMFQNTQAVVKSITCVATLLVLLQLHLIKVPFFLNSYYA